MPLITFKQMVPTLEISPINWTMIYYSLKNMLILTDRSSFNQIFSASSNTFMYPINTKEFINQSCKNKLIYIDFIDK